MSRPLARVAVIVPTYNYARFLPDALASLQAQSYPLWECLVIDDGSTDDTAEMVSDFGSRDSRIRLIRRDRAGVSAARNVGLVETSTEYIQFLDADDRLEPDKLRAHMEYLDRHPNVGIVFGDAATFSAPPGASGPLPLELGPPIGRGNAVIERLVVRNSLVVHAPMTRRSVVDEVGRFAEDLVVLEDWDFWMRCAVADVAFAHDAPLDSRALVRLHARSATRDRYRMTAATVDLRLRFERLALSTPARRSNARYLARASLKLAVADLRRGRLRTSALGLLRAAPRLVRSRGFRSVGSSPP